MKFILFKGGVMNDEKNRKPLERFHCVDALRGVAALVIVVFHYHHFYLADAFDRSAIPSTETFPYASLLAPFFGPLAAKAVELFWLISGFVFSHVYLQRHSSAWAFAVARFARLYPLHFLTLIYVAALQAVSLNMVGHWQVYGNNDLRHFGLQLLMSSNSITWARGLSFNGPIWSVSLEILVYAIFFMSLSLMRQRPMLVSLILCAVCWTWVAIEPVPLPIVHIGVVECAGYFFLGSLLYALRPDEAFTRAAALIILGTSIAIVGAVTGFEEIAIGGVAVAVVSIAAGADRAVPAWAGRLSRLGDISYGVYLVHVPIQMTVLLVADLAFGGSRDFANSYLTLPVYLVTSVLIAGVLYKCFERPAGQAIRTLLLRP